jgi:hypothetical protein
MRALAIETVVSLPLSAAVTDKFSLERKSFSQDAIRTRLHELQGLYFQAIGIGK